LEDRHAAWLAGVDYGMQQRVDLAIEDRARELLHHQALEALGMAQRLARRKGPAWAALIRQSSERP